jgi:hypothetical protein
MTSQQLRSRLEEALDIIGEVERHMERTDYAATGWDGVTLHHRVTDFMALHRQSLRDGGGL